MKKVLSVVLALSMALGLAGCSSKTASNSVSGTFEGTAKGMQGDVVVSMTVEKGEISKKTLSSITHGTL